MHSSSQIFIIPRGTSRHVLSKLILLLTNQDNVSDSILKSSSKNKILEFCKVIHNLVPQNLEFEIEPKSLFDKIQKRFQLL